MNYLLANDTSNSMNPGCKGTVAVLRSCLASCGLKEVAALPVGTGKEYFQECHEEPWNPWKERSWFDRLIYGTQPWAFHPAKVNLSAWHTAVQTWCESVDLSGADHVVINAEGTIHHNQGSALALLGLAKIAQIKGIQVSLVNGTFQSMDPRVLREVLPGCWKVFVREPFSLRYLKRLSIDSQLVPDCLFAYALPAASTERPYCLYSPGALADSHMISEAEIISELQAIQQNGFEPIYIIMEDSDRRHASIAEGLGIPLADMASQTMEQFMELLGKSFAVLGGRYHLTIYAWLMQTQTAARSSNTWKMEAVHKLAGLPWTRLDVRRSPLKTVCPSPAKLSELKSQVLGAYRAGFTP
ncbi:polysaccharide pyruvyl transferase family protein [Bremerella cremea]|uniref:polysaccharide pyruvyl transferase family protein n=1 Tax=Bremerella cremea TaxID=1031537 RepID=UPI0031E9A5C7